MILKTCWDKTGEKCFKLPQHYDFRLYFSSDHNTDFEGSTNSQKLTLSLRQLEQNSVSGFLQKRYCINVPWTDKVWQPFWNSSKFLYHNLL